MPDSNHDLDEIVQRSIQVEVPANVEERLHRRLSEFRERIEQRPPSRLRALADSVLHPTSMRVPLMNAALLAVVVLLAVLPRGSKAGRVYAAAANQLSSAHSLEYTVELAPYTEIDFSYLAPGYRQVKCSWGTETRSDGSGKQIVLMHVTKNYIVEEGQQTDAPDLIEQFKSLPTSAHEALGEQIVDGRKLFGYRVRPSKSEMPDAILKLSALDLWVDAATGKPDHVDISIQEPNKPLYLMHIKKILVDAEMDPSHFDMTPPAGYTKIGNPDAAEQATLLGDQQSGLRPEIKQAGALTAVVLPMQGSFTQTRSADDSVQMQLEKITRQLAKIGVTPSGPALGCYDPQQNWVAGYPVPPGTRIDAPFELLAVPESSVASVVVTGPWGKEFASPWGHDSGSRWATFVMWIGRQGYKPAGAPMEFWSGDDAHPQTQTTEMRIAVVKAK
jgi:outer membrane lipoprotein-sorting protein/predicted transcriptional regulator YdeE